MRYAQVLRESFRKKVLHGHIFLHLSHRVVQLSVILIIV